MIIKTRGRGGRGQTAAGGFLIMAISFLSAILVVEALVYAAGTGQRHQAALAAAGCEPNLSPSGQLCTTVWLLARHYAAIADPAGQRLSVDMAAYTASEQKHLAVAEAALTAQVSTEYALGTSLARFPFPPAIAPAATELIRDDHALAGLTARQARSSSLPQMLSFNRRVRAASAVVQRDIARIHVAFESRPTASQEP